MFNDPILVGNTLIMLGYVSELLRHLGHLRPHGRFTAAAAWRRRGPDSMACWARTAGAGWNSGSEKSAPCVARRTGPRLVSQGATGTRLGRASNPSTRLK